jgi:phytoene dehydrogenase-like protein
MPLSLIVSASNVIVIGSGPNGLAAAIRLAQSGLKVTVIEAEATVGGGARSAELTLPGFVHDVCSAVHPLALSSPFFRTLPLEEHGLEWIQPPVALAHPLDDGTAVLLYRSVQATAAGLGVDGSAYRKLVEPLAHGWDELARDLLGPMRFPKHPISVAKFGVHALGTARSLATSNFSGERARALFAGLSAHSMLPLEKMATAAFGLVLAASGHAVGWPFPRGGAQKISDALASHLQSLGGAIITGLRVDSLDQLSPALAILCDVTPRQLLKISESRLPDSYNRKLERYRYGPGAFKVDWALSAPIPWRARECALAGTVHIGGTLEEIAASERAPWEGEHAERPFVILAQPTLFDPSRAPEGKHIAWAYCHVPNGSTFDMLERIETQIERFAPGFREVILARSVMNTAALEAHNPNLVGGDINGGAQDVGQLFMRPTSRLYSTPAPRVYLCSASTPPGGGVHGMCGYFAAGSVLRGLAR